MKDRIEKAREAGYTDEQITEAFARKDPRISKAIEAGFKPDQIVKRLEEHAAPVKDQYEHGIASFAAQHPKEAAAGVGISNIVHPAEMASAITNPGGIANIALNVARGKGLKVPTPITEKLEELSGISELSPEAKEEAEVLNFAAGLLPWAERLLKLGNVGKAGKGTKPPGPPSGGAGAGEATFQEGRASLIPTDEKFVRETFDSGLSKPRAVESPNKRYATISKETRKEAIGKLDKEAQGLIKSKIEKHVPISKKIQEGFDFEGQYTKDFGDLKRIAEKYNPEINTSPLNKFFSSTREKFRGIPNPHADAKSIIREMSAFNRRVPSDLKDLLRIRRSNGQKLNAIYEQRLLKGKRHEYADFLTEMNRKIDESIGHTLPEDSAWFKKYKSLNSEYSEYKKAQSTLQTLEPLLREKISSSALTRLAEDPKKQKFLKIKMGDQGADEVIQLAKDLKKARDSIKEIPVKELHKYDAIWPISWAFKPLGVITTIRKGVDYARKGYGYYLSSPKKIKVFDEMLQAVASKDIVAYQKAVNKLPD